MINYQQLNDSSRVWIRLVCITLLIGLSLGLYYVSLNSGYKKESIREYYLGNDQNQDVDEFQYGKSLKELVLTTHNHVLGFVFILFIIHFFWLGIEMNSKVKLFFLIEPYISLITTFSSMFLIRFVSAHFTLLIILSSITLYTSLYFMIFRILYELKKS